MNSAALGSSHRDVAIQEVDLVGDDPVKVRVQVWLEVRAVIGVDFPAGDAGDDFLGLGVRSDIVTLG